MQKSREQFKTKQLKDSPHPTDTEGKSKLGSDHEGWHEAAREYGVELILHRIRADLDLRKRVRKLLEELPADAPGKTSSISGEFVVKAVEHLVALGVSYEEAYRRLSFEGATAEAIKRRYYRSKKRSGK